MMREDDYQDVYSDQRKLLHFTYLHAESKNKCFVDKVLLQRVSDKEKAIGGHGWML